MTRFNRISAAAAAAALVSCAAPAAGDVVEGLEEFGELTLVDSVECAVDTAHMWRDYPSGRSFVTNILGEACVAMRPVSKSETSLGEESSSYVAWRIGKGRGLVPNDPYVLVIEYPDDAPRSATVMNFGNWTHHGFATGFAVPDNMSPPYVAQVLETYAIPLSNTFKTFKEAMFPMEMCQQLETSKKNGAELHDLPENGFDVVFALFPQEDCTDSVGVAVKSIRLYHVDDYAAARAEIHYPAGSAPRRHVTVREEMGDNYAMQGYPEGRKALAYEAKARLMSLLGVDTVSRDMLEFGYLQGWNSSYDGSLNGGKFAARQEPFQYVRTIVVTNAETSAAATNVTVHSSYNGPGWEYDGPVGQIDDATTIEIDARTANGYGHWSSSSETWSDIVGIMAAEGHYILPYYEYSGGRGPYGWGNQGQRPAMLNTEGYGNSQGWSNQSWINAATADLTEPGTREDFEDLLNLTLLRYANEPRYEGIFLGAWMRNRAQVPMGFSDRAVARFVADEAAWLAANGHDTNLVTRLYIHDRLAEKKAEWEAENGKMGDVDASQYTRWGCDVYNRYREWWYRRRRDFFAAMRDYMSTNGLPGARMFYHSCTAEPGEQWDSWWPPTSIYAGDGADSLWNGMDWKAMTGKTGNADMMQMAGLYKTRALDTDFSNFWGLEINHSAPADDYWNYGPAATAAGEPQERIGLSYPYSRVYQVVAPEVSGAYRNASGDLFFVHHYSLNEHALQDKNLTNDAVRMALAGTDDPGYFKETEGDHQQIAGYFCSDFDHAGRAVVLSELWAMAVSDPTMLARLYGTNIGQLDSDCFREFNLNYLSLPAQPGEALRGCRWGENLHVRKWHVDAGGGSPACDYYAVVNTDTHPWEGRVEFSGAAGHVYKTVDWAEVDLDASSAATLSLEPLQMVAFRTLPPDRPAVAVRATATSSSSVLVKVDVLAIPSGSGRMTVRISPREDMGDATALDARDLASKGSFEYAAAGLDPDVRYFVRADVEDSATGAVGSKTTSARTASDPACPRAALSVRSAGATSATLVADVSSLGEGAASATLHVRVADSAGALASREYVFPGVTYATSVANLLDGLSSSTTWFATAWATNDLGRGALLGSVSFDTTGIPDQEAGGGRWQSGLWQHRVAQWASDYSERAVGQPDAERANGPVMAAWNSRKEDFVNPLSGNSWGWPGSAKTAYVYEGAIWLEGGREYVVNHAFDNGTYFEIDGVQRGLNGYGYGNRNVFDPVSFEDDGWHFVKFIVWDASGNVGPQTGLPADSPQSGFVWNDLGTTNKTDKSVWHRFEDPGDGSFLRTWLPERNLVELDRPLSRDGAALVVPVSVDSFDEDNALDVFLSSSLPADGDLHDPAAWEASASASGVGVGKSVVEVVAAGAAPAAGGTVYAIARLFNVRTGREDWSLVASYTTPEDGTLPEFAASVAQAGFREASFDVRVSAVGSGAASAMAVVSVWPASADPETDAPAATVSRTATAAEWSGAEPLSVGSVLSYATAYVAVISVSNSAGASAEPVRLSFRTKPPAAPQATLFASAVSFTAETFVVDVSSLGTDAATAEILFEFSGTGDFSDGVVSETRTVSAAGPQEFSFGGLEAGTGHWARATVTSANGKVLRLAALDVPTPAYSAPLFGVIRPSTLWPDGATVSIPVAALGAGSDRVDVEWTLVPGAGVPVPDCTLSGTLRYTAAGTHDVEFPVPALSPGCGYSMALRATGSIGLVSETTFSFSTREWLVALGAHSASVSTNGTPATMSVEIVRASPGSALALLLNGETVATWSGPEPGTGISLDVPVRLGSTNSYEFAIADSTGRYADSVSGSFLARRSVKWFEVAWDSDGYPAGAEWNDPAAAAVSGGSWTRPAGDGSVLSAALRLDVRSGAEGPAFAAAAASAAGRDVLASGVAQFTPSSAPLGAERAGVRAGLALHAEEGGEPVLFGYDGEAWHALSGEAPVPDAWTPWTAEFDFTGTPAVRYSTGGEVHPRASDGKEWLPLAGPAAAERSLSGVSFSGDGGTGGFGAVWYENEPAERRAPVVLFVY